MFGRIAEFALLEYSLPEFCWGWDDAGMSFIVRGLGIGKARLSNLYPGVWSPPGDDITLAVLNSKSDMSVRNFAGGFAPVDAQFLASSGDMEKCLVPIFAISDNRSPSRNPTGSLDRPYGSSKECRSGA